MSGGDGEDELIDEEELLTEEDKRPVVAASECVGEGAKGAEGYD